jgi:hypothetical protein
MVLVLALVCLGCEPASTPSPPAGTLTGAEENVLGNELADAAGGFAYRMPAGWSAVRVPELDFPLAQEPQYPGYRSNIRVTREQVPTAFDLYLQQGKTSLPELLDRPVVLEDTEFTTLSGLKGRRWRVRSRLGDGEILQLFYLFPGPGDAKIAMTASCTTFQESRMVFAFDAAAKTLRLD